MKGIKERFCRKGSAARVESDAQVPKPWQTILQAKSLGNIDYRPDVFQIQSFRKKQNTEAFRSLVLL